jgi:hypothetical protein
VEDDEDESSLRLHREVADNGEEEKRQKRDQVLKLLAEGETGCSPLEASGTKKIIQGLDIKFLSKQFLLFLK